MRKIIYFGFVGLLTLASCAKETNPAITGTVTIGGASYKTITISGRIWTSANYTGAGGMPYAGSRLYTYGQAGAISLPSGWRLPTQDDFNNLVIAAKNAIIPDTFNFDDNDRTTDYPYVLMSTSGWAGVNSLGFNAMPAGYGTLPGPSFTGSGTNALFWTSTGNTNQHLALAIIKPGNFTPDIAFNTWNTSNYASIRFVKDN